MTAGGILPYQLQEAARLRDDMAAPLRVSICPVDEPGHLCIPFRTGEKLGDQASDAWLSLSGAHGYEATTAPGSGWPARRVLNSSISGPGEGAFRGRGRRHLPGATLPQVADLTVAEIIERYRGRDGVAPKRGSGSQPGRQRVPAGSDDRVFDRRGDCAPHASGHHRGRGCRAPPCRYFPAGRRGSRDDEPHGAGGGRGGLRGSGGRTRVGRSRRPLRCRSGQASGRCGARLLGVAATAIAALALFAKGSCGLECGEVTGSLAIAHTPFYYALGTSMATYSLLLASRVVRRPVASDANDSREPGA